MSLTKPNICTSGSLCGEFFFLFSLLFLLLFVLTTCFLLVSPKYMLFSMLSSLRAKKHLCNTRIVSCLAFTLILLSTSVCLLSTYDLPCIHHSSTHRLCAQKLASPHYFPVNSRLDLIRFYMPFVHLTAFFSRPKLKRSVLGGTWEEVQETAFGVKNRICDQSVYNTTLLDWNDINELFFMIKRLRSQCVLKWPWD